MFWAITIRRWKLTIPTRAVAVRIIIPSECPLPTRCRLYMSLRMRANDIVPSLLIIALNFVSLYVYFRRRGTFGNKYDSTSIAERPKEKPETREDDALFSLFVNNDTETRLSAADERDTPDLRVFWRDEGNVRSIREARGTCGSR